MINLALHCIALHCIIFSNFTNICLPTSTLHKKSSPFGGGYNLALTCYNGWKIVLHQKLHLALLWQIWSNGLKWFEQREIIGSNLKCARISQTYCLRFKDFKVSLVHHQGDLVIMLMIRGWKSRLRYKAISLHFLIPTSGKGLGTWAWNKIFIMKMDIHAPKRRCWKYKVSFFSPSLLQEELTVYTRDSLVLQLNISQF